MLAAHRALELRARAAVDAAADRGGEPDESLTTSARTRRWACPPDVMTDHHRHGTGREVRMAADTRQDIQET